METLRNEPVNLYGGAGNGGYGSGWGGGGGFMEALVAASLLGGNGFNNRGATVIPVAAPPATVEMSALINQQANADTRRDVADSTSEVRESIHAQTIANHAEFRGLDCKLFGISRDALASKYESAIATKDANALLISKVDCETNSLRLQNTAMQVSIDKQFCDLHHSLISGLNSIEKREMQREIDELRRDSAADQNSVVIGLLKELIAKK